MAFSLFPRIPKFAELFRRHSDVSRQAAAHLEAIFAGTGDRADHGHAIIQLEREGSALSRECARLLSTTFITPIDREDIHLINTTGQTVLYLIRAVSTRVGLYGIAQIRPAARDLVQHFRLLLNIADDMRKRLHLRKDVDDLSHRVAAIRGETDMLLLVALGELYETDSSSPGAILEIIRWSQIYDRIEEALRGVEALTSAIEGVALKNA